MRKNVVCRLSPISSISTARKEFWTFTKRVPCGCFSPNKYGTSGCIPEEVNNVVGSFCGTSGELAMRLCPFFSKNEIYESIISEAFIVAHYSISRGKNEDSPRNP